MDAPLIMQFNDSPAFVMRINRIILAKPDDETFACVSQNVTGLRNRGVHIVTYR